MFTKTYRFILVLRCRRCLFVMQNLPAVFFGPRPHPESLRCHGDTRGSEGGEVRWWGHGEEKERGRRRGGQCTCREEEEKMGGGRLRHCGSCDGRPGVPPTLRLRRHQGGAEGGSCLEEHRGRAERRGGGAHTLLLCQSGCDWSSGHLGARSKEPTDDGQRSAASG